MVWGGGGGARAGGSSPLQENLTSFPAMPHARREATRQANNLPMMDELNRVAGRKVYEKAHAALAGGVRKEEIVAVAGGPHPLSLGAAGAGGGWG